MTIYITRGLGKSYEEKMYKELGGMPTTIIFRFDDNICLLYTSPSPRDTR